MIKLVNCKSGQEEYVNPDHVKIAVEIKDYITGANGFPVALKLIFIDGTREHYVGSVEDYILAYDELKADGI